MKRMVRALIATMALAVLVCVVLGYGGGLLFELDVLAHFRLHLLLAIPPLACIALWVRHWRALGRFGAAALLAAAGLGVVLETPQLAPAGQDTPARTFTVMTANLYQHNDQPELMRAALLALDPDILVTNETGRSAMEGLTSLDAHFPFRLSLVTRGRVLRTVIWSKFPMRDGTLFLEDQVEPTGVRAIIELGPEIEIGLLGLHFAHPGRGNQGIQIEALDAIAEAMPERRIVLGDLNLTPWSWSMRRTEALTQTQRVKGYRVTWHGHYNSSVGQISDILGQPIDHILVSKDIAVQEIRTVEIPGSDHLAVFATIQLPGEPGLLRRRGTPYVAHPDGEQDALGHTRDGAVRPDPGASVRRLPVDVPETVSSGRPERDSLRRTRSGWPASSLPQ